MITDYSEPILLTSTLSEKLFAATSNDQLQHLATSVKEEIQSSRVSLLQIIESIESNVVNVDIKHSEKAIHFLVLILKETYSLYSTHEVHLLFTFFTNQLSESAFVPFLTQGLLLLLEHKLIHEKLVLLLIKKIFNDVSVPQFSQAVRHMFFRIFDLAIEHHFKYLSTSLKNDLILGFISTMDGEKDPRNLMIVFKLLHFFAKHCTLEECAQDLFETAFSYFPVSFKPPPEDPYGITPQDLKNALAHCLSASSSFASFALPCLFEKLQSTNTNAKRDTLQVLCLGLPVYGSVSLIPKAFQLWKLLKTEIFQSVDTSYEKLALLTLEIALKVLSTPSTLSPFPPTSTISSTFTSTSTLHASSLTTTTMTTTVSSTSNPVDIMFTPAVQECLQHLQKPDTKLAKTAGLILKSLIQSHLSLANRLLPLILPFLATGFKSVHVPSHQKTYMDALNEVLMACKTHVPYPETLRPMTPDIFTLLLQTTQSSSSSSMSLMLAGYKGIFHLLSIPGLTTPEEQRMYTRCLTDLLLHTTIDEVKEASKDYLSQLSIQQPSLIHTFVLPELFSNLTTTTVNEVEEEIVIQEKGEEEQEGNQHKEQGIEKEKNKQMKQQVETAIFTTLIALANSHELFLSILFSLVELIGSTSSPSPLKALLSTILSVIQTTNTIPIDPLQKIVKISLTRSFDEDTLHSLCEIASTMTRKLPSLSDEEAIVQLVFETQLGNSPSTFPIFTGIIGNLHGGISLPWTESQFVEQALLTTSKLPMRYVSKLIASIINKSNQPDTLLLNPSLYHLLKELTLPNVHLSLWVTKALLMRSHPSGFELCEDILSYLTSNQLELRFQVAEKLGVLVSESKTVLNAESHAIVKPLYKQRTFQFCLSKISEKLLKAPEDQREVLLLALRKLLENVSNQVLLASAEELAPLLLVALDHPTSDVDLLLCSIQAFESMVLEAPDIAIPHVRSLVKLLLDLLGPEKHKLNIRIAALSCLSSITQLKYSVKHPLKQIVLRGLIPSLDDPKRIVRRHAVNCRSLWYLSQAE